MSKSGSTFTYNDPFKQAGQEKTKTQKAIRNDFGFGSFFSADPAAQPLFVSDLSIDAFLELLPLFSGISDLSDTPKLTVFKNAFDEVTASHDSITFGTVKGLFDSIVAQENLLFDLSKTLLDDIDSGSLAKITTEKYTEDSADAEENITLSQLKLLRDEYSADSFTKFFTTKVVSDSVSEIEDLFERTVIYNRQFNNEALIESRSTLEFTKSLEDGSNVDQFFVVDFDKFVGSEVTTDQQVSFATSKLLQDIVYTADLIGVPDGLLYQFNTPEQAAAATDDDFTRLVNYKRTFTEELPFTQDNAPQPFAMFSLFSEPQEEESAAYSEDILTIQSNLVKFDNSVAQSFNSIVLAKPLADHANPDQLISLRPSKTIIENLTSTDDDTLTIGKNVFNNVDISQLIAFDVSKSIDESVEPVQFIALTSNLFKEDNSDTEDQILLAFATSFANDSEATDDSVILTGKGLTETILTPDDQSFSVSKFLNDSVITEDLVSIPDGVTYSSTKAIFDSVNATQDFFTRTLIANRLIESIVDTINDGQTLFTSKGLAHNTVLLDDQAFDVNKVLRNSSNAVEQIALDLDKPLEDSFDAEQRIFLSPNLFKEDVVNNISDLSNIDYTKVQRDSQALSDDLSVSFEKTLKDSVGIIDAFVAGDGLTYRFNNPESDEIGVSELFERVLQYGRVFDDSTLSTDSSTLAPTLNKSDIATTTQRIVLDFTTSFDDDASAEESIALNPVLLKTSDVSNLSDTDTLAITLGKFENITTSQFLAFAVEKELQSSYGASETISLSMSLGTISDSTNQSTDTDTIQFTKGIVDPVTNSDDQLFDVSKLLKDDANVDDLVAVPDGATYYATKKITSFASASEVFEMLRIFNRTFEEFQNATDASVIAFGKIQSENVPASDDSTLDISKGVDEIISPEQFISLDFSTSFDEARTVQDTPKLNPVLYKDDLVGTGDDFTISFEVVRLFEDSVISQELLALATSIVKSHGANADESISLSPEKVFNNSIENIEDALSLSPNLGKSDSSFADDSAPVFDVSKLLKDDANIDDLVAVPDGATYYATKNLKHSLSSSDIFDLVVNYNRSFSNSASTTSFNVFSLSKAINNEVLTTHIISFDVNKQILDEEALPTVFVSLSADKFLSDTLDQLDTQKLTVGKVIGSDYTTSDVFDYNVIYSRTFNHAVQPVSNISFDVSTLRTDSSDVLQRIFLSADKKVDSSVNGITETATLNPQLLKIETVLTEQNLAFDVSKLLKDDANIDDLVAVPDGATYYATKRLASFINSPSDIFARVVDYNRAFSHIVSLISDNTSFNTGKLLKDSSATDDIHILSVDKSILADEATQSVFVALDLDRLETDVVENIGDSQVLSPGLFKEDSALATELLTYVLIYSRTFENSVGSSQFISLDTALVKDDFALAEQFVSLQPGKFVTSAVTNFSDTQSLQPGLVKKHEAVAEETSIFDVSKLLKDSANVDDLIAVPDGATYYATKLLTDINISALEDFSRVVDYNRAFTHSSSLTDDGLTIGFDKLLDDIPTISDIDVLSVSKSILDDDVTQSVFVSTDFTKVRGDSVSGIGDSQVLSPGLFKEDSALATELLSYILTYRRTFEHSAITDQFIALDTALVKDDFALAEQFVAIELAKPFENEISNLTDSQVIQPELVKRHEAVAEEISIFDISKLLKDDANVEDLVAVPDGATYYATKNLKHSLSSSDIFDRVVNYNREFGDSYATSDDQSFNVTKLLQHSATAETDFVKIDADLVKTDVVSNPDVFVAINADKLLKSSYLSEDNALLASTLVKGSNAGADDAFSKLLTYNRFFSNGVTQSDDDAIDFGKNLSHIISSLDDQSLDINKFLDDSITLDDAISLDGSTYSLSKRLSHKITNISDDQSFDVNKFLDDSITLDDAISLDGSTYDLDKLLDDLAQALDDQIINSGKVLLDFASSVEYNVISFTKGLANDANTSDNDVFDINKVLSHEILPDDPLSISIDKPFDDLALATDPVKLNPTKFVESDYSVSDFDVTQFTKGLSHSAGTLLDNQIFDISKTLKDSSSIDDLVGVPDGSTYYATKRLEDVYTASDYYAKVWNVVRGFSHSSNSTTDFVQILSNINKEETLSTNDSDIFNVGLFKSDTTAAIEDMVFRFDKGGITDNVVLLENAKINFAFGTISDSVGEEESVALQPGLSKEDNTSAASSGQAVAQNYTADAFYWAEDYVGESRTF